MHRVTGAGDPHVLTGTTPCDRSDIGVGQPVGIQCALLGGLYFIDAKGDVEIDQFAGLDQPLRMCAAFENLAVIGALPFKYRAGIMHRMGQNMDIGLAPIDQRPVHPDFAIAIVIASHSVIPFSHSLH